MSNYPTITRTIFQGIDETGKATDVSYGIRVYDNEGAAYSNFIGSLEELVALSHEDLIDEAISINSEAAAMIDFARENDIPVNIDGVDYNFGKDKIAP